MKEEVEILRVEFACTNCGKWEENETGMTFYQAVLCKNVEKTTKIRILLPL